MVKIYNFPPHIKGDTFKGKTFTISINGELIDTTTYTVKMQLRKGRSTSYPVALELSTTNGEIVKDDTNNGQFRIIEQVIAIPAGKYVYDMEFTSGGKVRTWIKGVWTITRETTQLG
jgi:hypothetical protein